MNSQRFAEVESAFHRLLSFDEEDRSEALEALRSEEPEVADEVARLLRASEETRQLGDWGDQGDGAVHDSALDYGWTADEAPAPPMPERIGNFRVVSELGRGGMGVVYLGEREDEFHQRVAIKVVQRGFDAEMLGRLRRERQILATLDHPNIARLVDGGSTDDGRPFFAMDHIEGRDLLAWCNENCLDVRQRVRLFVGVCAAVQYAHRNLVIHRDLKPSNILVTDDGVPKLLDFGIAKLLAAEASDETRTGLVPMTPDYASPEQMLGEPLTTATDVYSLGVVLFELLTGVHPYAERVTGPASLARLLHAANAPKASSRVLERGDAHDDEGRGGPPMRNAQLARTLRGDLDNILAMALRREPDRRYPSVAELADDLRRYLDLRPVHAHPESLGYRVGRFVRRQKLLAAAGLLVFVSMAVGITSTTWQARKAEQARLAAEQQAELAQTVSSYLVEIFGEPDPGKHLGNEPKASDLLARGRDRLDDLDGQPGVQAELALVIGQAYQQLGRYDDAKALFRRCLELRTVHLAPPHPKLVEGLLYLSDAESLLGETEAAQSHLLEAIEQQKMMNGDPIVFASLLNDLGVNQYRRGELDDALASTESALALRRKHLGPRHVETARTLANFASIQVTQGKVEEAVAPMREVLGIYEETLGPDHPWSLEAQSNLAVILFHLGRNDEAIRAYRSLTDSQRRVYGGSHPLLGGDLTDLGWILLQTESANTEALPVFQEALDVLESTVGNGDEEYLRALVGRGKAYAARGQTEDAAADFRKALESTPNDESPHGLKIAAWSGLGRTLAEDSNRQGEAARALCSAILERATKSSASGSRSDRADREKLAALLDANGVAQPISAYCRDRLSAAPSL